MGQAVSMAWLQPPSIPPSRNDCWLNNDCIARVLGSIPDHPSHSRVIHIAFMVEVFNFIWWDILQHHTILYYIRLYLYVCMYVCMFVVRNRVVKCHLPFADTGWVQCGIAHIPHLQNRVAAHLIWGMYVCMYLCIYACAYNIYIVCTYVCMSHLQDPSLRSCREDQPIGMEAAACETNLFVCMNVCMTDK